ncbi:hypothetical protein CAPTEDRAFT_23665, partial [Capitella teleta]
MDEAVMKRVLGGVFDEIPAIHSQTVRIFTSSTFTDTIEERNMLMEEVYPRLKDYCRSKYGLEFQVVVDMRWGVRDEAADDHITTSLCLQEIAKCQADSIGPNFVTFLGQRHGYRPFPSTINCSEFEILKSSVLNEQHRKLMCNWFLLDENALKPEYVLQPISSKITDYLSKDEDLKRKAQRKWSDVFQTLQSTLRQAASVCLQNGRMSKDDTEKYFMSVTEQEIQQGVFKTKGDINNQCLCYIRIIEDITENLSHSLAWRFIDLVDNANLDIEAQGYLERLRDNRLVQALETSNVFKANVKWSEDGGINRDSHKDYLRHLMAHFEQAMMMMVDRCMVTSKRFLKNSLFVEVYQHSCMAKDRCQVFHGRERLLGRVQKELNASRGSRLIVIHGQSGSGKTSIIAKCAQQVSGEVSEWIPEKSAPKVVLRFLGTTPSSSSIHRTLESICNQISYLYTGCRLPESIDNFSELQKRFQLMLSSASANSPLVVILDSLDQLSGDDFAHKLGWLPKSLPPHC